MQYDWLPSWCAKCAQFGHVVDVCRMGLSKSKSQLQVNEDGFRPLRKAFQPRVRIERQQGGKKDSVGPTMDTSQQPGQHAGSILGTSDAVSVQQLETASKSVTSQQPVQQGDFVLVQ